ncbi:MAG TPA: GntR family transcriptional regulator [Bryobacteraceae bacterium]|jgi:DNA-binding transcriptional regulator YhcF (GntR family)|nr:GntR family transcriptional regulator [Bryobacteraceae bacterium]
MTGEAKPGAPFRFQLNLRSGVPVYRQIIDQVLVAVASGACSGGDQLPTVRQLAVDLSINPNTVVRAYRELEIRGILTTHQGTGTFITETKVDPNDVERQRQLSQLVSEFVAHASGAGFTLQEVIDRLAELQAEQGSIRR